MAKKKYSNQPVAMNEYTPKPRSDNNPSSGCCPLPNEDLNGNTDPMILKRLCEAVAPGESANSPDVIVQTPSGVSSSFGKDKGKQYNWGDGDAGSWNDGTFPGGNMTGA